MKMIALFSLCGVSSLTVNHWSIKPEASLDHLKALMSGMLGDGIYVGASMRKHWNGKDKTLAQEENPEKKAALEE